MAGKDGIGSMNSPDITNDEMARYEHDLNPPRESESEEIISPPSAEEKMPGDDFSRGFAHLGSAEVDVLEGEDQHSKAKQSGRFFTKDVYATGKG